MEIAVIGGGHGCYASAVSLTEQGHNVRLWRRNATAFGHVIDSKIITLTDSRGKRDVTISAVTDSLPLAIEEAELVVLLAFKETLPNSSTINFICKKFI